ncbi:MAG: MarR family transcriptional regulator [Burkholderiales bacterium]|nr:MarR family transcriptional regulator [Burkholderiales bacterium]
MPIRKRQRPTELDSAENATLAAFRHALRVFLRFSEAAAEKVGLTAQHYQAMLVVRAAAEREEVTINELARQLLIRHNSAVGLVDRLVKQELLVRSPSREDRRKVSLRLTARGSQVLGRLADNHRHELERFGPQLRQLLRHIARTREHNRV